ncbi:twin-arginine translocase TatA/TatE family subunit [Amycolatopsis alba]|uniref:Twin-arginine translocase subunit TatB n=1 Tax=Amycolatopsis alba DSM 44262 TaxID=1125972 RepID=A0A229RSQ6_AMYAL|nr:twin-arginine translocase TatA/TatE family subunit [Amycolatopsis alba]OXM49692.1 twin-arginine translocase subunit TatB [Amycolatopsis alba DSM 44262]
MFGLSLEHLLILLVAGLFVLGPERLPESARWLAKTLTKAREFATGAQNQLRTELGTEYQQLRKPLQDLSALRNLDPRTAVSRHLLDDPRTGTHPLVSSDTEFPSAVPRRNTGAPLTTGERAPFDPDAT